MRRLYKLFFFIYIFILPFQFPVSVIAQESVPESAQISSQSALASDSTALDSNNLDISSASADLSPTASTLPDLDSQDSAPSASQTFPVNVHRLSKKTFRADEKITIVVGRAAISDLEVSLFNVDGVEIPVQMEEINLTDPAILRIIPPNEFKAGRYTLKIKDKEGNISTQDFTWGVLAINTNKSIYLPAETAKLSMAVLDETGMMVCDAKVELRIKNQESAIDELLSTDNGKIIVNPDCHVKDLTLKPDYEAAFEVSALGSYQMELSAETANGVYSITDSFEARESVPFDVERISATRLYPPKTYPVTFDILANEDFNGTIIETIPGVFAISKQDGVRSFDEETLVSAKAVQEDSLEAAVPRLATPFEGEHAITLGFGERINDPRVKGLYDSAGLLGHDGLDFEMPQGTSVLAVDDGEVVKADPNGVYGTTVVIQHSWGKSYYGHLSLIAVKEGEKRAKGDPIGMSGNTGLTTGAHLHFGIKPNNNDLNNGYFGKINPFAYIEFGFKVSNPTLATEIPNIISNSQTESLPDSKILGWRVDLKKGDRIKLGYNFKVPEKSPYFYQIGPLEFKDKEGKTTFQEIRLWQLAADVGGVVSRVISSNNQFGSSVGNNAYRYFSPVTGYLYSQSTQANGTITFREAGTISNLRVRVLSGDRNLSSPAVTTIINGSTGSSVIDLAPGGVAVGAGEYVDSVNTDSISSGDTVSIRAYGGTGGSSNWTFTIIGFDWTPLSGTTTRLGAIHGGQAYALNKTYYTVPGGDLYPNETQANGEWLVKLPAGVSGVTLRNLYVRLSGNTFSANPALTVTVNGASGAGTAPSVSFANNTGAQTQEDTTNSIIANDGDKISFKVVTAASGTGSSTITEIAMEVYDASNGVSFLVSGNSGGIFFVTTNYRFPLGGGLYSNSIESRSQATLSFDATLSLLSAYIKQGGTGTIALRAGGADVGSPGTVSVSTATGGAWVTDSTNTYTADAADLVNYNVTRTSSPEVTTVAITVQVGGGAPETASLSQLMRHGKWFNSSGVRQSFTF